MRKRHKLYCTMLIIAVYFPYGYKILTVGRKLSTGGTILHQDKLILIGNISHYTPTPPLQSSVPLCPFLGFYVIYDLSIVRITISNMYNLYSKRLIVDHGEQLKTREEHISNNGLHKTSMTRSMTRNCVLLLKYAPKVIVGEGDRRTLSSVCSNTSKWHKSQPEV